MPSQPLSLTAYAKRRGVSAVAVSKAVKRGRLRESVVTVDGQPKIADPELADREWAENTRQRGDQATRPDVEAATPEPEAPKPERPEPVRPSQSDGAVRQRRPAGLPDSVPPFNVSQAVRAQAAARREAAAADRAELELAQRRGELVDVASVRAEVIARYSLVKTKLLGVPSDLAQRLPHLATEVVPMAKALIRKALEELVTGDGGDDA